MAAMGVTVATDVTDAMTGTAMVVMDDGVQVGAMTGADLATTRPATMAKGKVPRHKAWTQRMKAVAF